MTQTPNYSVEPVRKEDRLPEQQPTERPAAEKVTPSQQGKFRGALEKKEGKKKVSPKGGELIPEETETVEGEGSVFQLAGNKPVKGQKPLTEGSTGGESGEEGEEGTFFGKGDVRPGKIPATPASPTLPQQAAAAQAQMQPLPISGPAPQTPAAPKAGAAATSRLIGEAMQAAPKGRAESIPIAPETEVEPKEGFQKLLKKEGRVVEEVPRETVEKTVLPEQRIVTPSLIAEAKAPAVPEKAARLGWLEVIRQTADAIATFVSKDVTSSVVTIKYPPIFEGATLTVTEYSSAPRQFNVTFANLSPDARRMIESVANQQQLKQALVERGYTVQNVFIESAPRTILPATSAEGGARGRYEGEGGEGAAGGEGGGELGGGPGGAM
jgi:hypothetical protein